MPIRVDACIASHLGDRQEQQDRVALLPHPKHKGMFMAVLADGMGGHTGGAQAAEQVIHSVKTLFANYSPANQSPEEFLRACLLETHAMIKASRFLNETDPHSTAVLLLVHGDRASWMHCGDSRLYHFHGAELIRRTIDHSYVERLLARGAITPEQALIHPNRNVLVTSLGGEELPETSFGEERFIAGGDNFILCSDGLWAYFTEEELGFTLASMSARASCEYLTDLARTRAQGNGDNISLVVVRLIERD